MLSDSKFRKFFATKRKVTYKKEVMFTMVEFQIKGPYDFRRVIERLSYDPINVVEIEKNCVVVPLVVYGDQQLTITVTFSGTVEASICSIDVPKQYEEEAVQKIIAIFQLDTSLEEINAHFHGTDLELLFVQYRGLPLTCEFDLYYSIMKTIIHQQLNLSFAHTLTERFVRNFGEEKDGFARYPTPERVSMLEYEDLRKLQFSQRKAEYVIDTSRLIAKGELDLNELSMKTDDEIIEELTKIRGIGYWTAENILLFGLGRKNLFPIKDVGIQNALKNLYKLDQKPSLEDMIHYSETWSPYKSYASLYLWESLNNQKARS